MGQSGTQGSGIESPLTPTQHWPQWASGAPHSHRVDQAGGAQIQPYFLLSDLRQVIAPEGLFPHLPLEAE